MTFPRLPISEVGETTGGILDARRTIDIYEVDGLIDRLETVDSEIAALTPIVRARVGVGSFVNLSQIEQTLRSVDIDIPATWTSYDLEITALVRTTLQPSSPRTATRLCTFQVRRDGNNISSTISKQLTNDATDDTDMVLATATAVGETTTGTVSLDVTAQLDSSGANDHWRAVVSELRGIAWRVT